MQSSFRLNRIIRVCTEKMRSYAEHCRAEAVLARNATSSMNDQKKSASSRASVAVTILAAARLTCGRALCLFGQAFKPAWIIHGDIGQDLAIQLDAGLFQSVDELAVAQAVQLGGGADADDPERAVLTLLLLASGVGELQPALTASCAAW